MIVNVKRKEFLMQLKKVAKAAVPGHPTKELAGILLETDGQVIRMTATNFEVAIRSELPATVERDGNAVIDARLLINVMDKLSGDNVYMELCDNNHLYIRSEQSRYDIAALEKKNYPAVEIPYPGDTISVSGLRSLIARSAFAAALKNPARPVMCCVNLIFSENGLRAIGCDGTCAAEATGDPDSKGSISLLVPAASLKLLALIADNTDVYEIGVTGRGGTIKNIVFSDGTTLFSARLMEGTYPDTDTLFAKLTPEAVARTDAKKLRNALDCCTVPDGGRVEFMFGDDGLILRCDSEIGKMTFALDADIELATTESYYYIPKNLLNCAKVLSGRVTLNFTKEKMLEIKSDSVRFFQVAARPSVKKAHETSPPAKAPRKKAVA